MCVFKKNKITKNKHMKVADIMVYKTLGACTVF